MRVNDEWSLVLRPGAAQRLDRIGARREPRRRRAEEDAGDERQAEGEGEHQRRRLRADRQELHVGEGERRAAAAPRPPRPAGRRRRRPIASSTLSTSACVTICRRDAPMRQPHRGLRRGGRRARASSRLATFAQAISSTRPQTASRICRLRPYCSFITPTPAPAGTIAMVCFGSRRRCRASSWRDSRSRAASTRAARRSAAAPCRRSVAPGLQPADHPQPGRHRLPQQRAAAGDERLLLQRNPQVRRIAAQRFAEEARRRDADRP